MIGSPCAPALLVTRVRAFFVGSANGSVETMTPTQGPWDPATSVGTTATMVAAARAIATTNGDINEQFAEPLVRAVGVTF